MKFRLLCSSVFLLLAFLPFSVVKAQVVTAEISGVVTDPSKSAVAGVKVVGKNLGTGFERISTTDEYGRYTLFALPLGPYSVRTESSTFKPMQRERLTLGIGDKVEVDFTLSMSDVKETVNVSEEAPQIQISSAQVGKTVNTASIDSLPLNGRDFAQLAALVPGVRQAGSSTTVRMSGQAYTSSSFKVDGMDNDSEYVSYRQARYSQDAIAEVQVLTNQFLPEFGRSSGGVVNVITRSGTNDFHGRAFYYGREDALDARNTFSTSKLPFERKQYGGTAGGPIKKDKTFFFGSVERLEDDNITFIVTPGLSADVPIPTRETLLFGKVTHQLNEKNLLQVNYNFDKITTGNQSVGGISLPDHSFTRKSTSNNVIFGDTTLLGPTTINELRVQFQRRDAGNIPDMPGRPEIRRPSSITGTPTSTPATWLENKVSISEALTHNFHAAGAHSIKAGAQLQFSRGNILTEVYDNGQYIFATDKPFNAADPTTYPTQYNLSTGSP
ncbi:MAG: carboxypeptidase-like regulatory domain-containing protein, partial [Bryobacteraceae bacterium]